jgi:hypothetical protein
MTKYHEDPIACPRCKVPAVVGDGRTCGFGESVYTYTCPDCGLWTKARGAGDVDTGWFRPPEKVKEVLA